MMTEIKSVNYGWEEILIYRKKEGLGLGEVTARRDFDSRAGY